jgi:DNA-directed RNA polymerase II subunit RPB1
MLSYRRALFKAMPAHPRHCEGCRPVAIQRAFQPALAFQVTEPPPGLPRRYAPRNDGGGGEEPALCSKEHAPRSKEYVPCSKEYAPCSKEYASCSKEYASCSKEYASCSKEYASCSKEYASCSKEYASCSKEYVPCSKEYVPTTPPISSTFYQPEGSPS